MVSIVFVRSDDKKRRFTQRHRPILAHCWQQAQLDRADTGWRRVRVFRPFFVASLSAVAIVVRSCDPPGFLIVVLRIAYCVL